MKFFTALALIIAVAGCTTMQPIDGSPTELQHFINSGELLKPGDRVRIVTADQKTHRFAITKVEAGLIVGSNESVPGAPHQWIALLVFRGVRNRGDTGPLFRRPVTANLNTHLLNGSYS